jgi:predicted PurR-regulated permease PerM
MFFGLGLVVLLVVALTLSRPYAVPIAVAVLIWFLISASTAALTRRAPALSGGWATAIALATLFALILATIRIVAGSVAALSNGLSGVDDRVLEAANALLTAAGLDTRDSLRALMASFDFEAALRQGIATGRELAANIALVFLYVMFLLVDQRYYEAKLRALAPDAQNRAWLRGVLRRIAEETRAYLWLMTLISIGVALATGVLLALFGVPGAAFWGFLAFALNFIPTIGSITAVALPALFALTQLPDLATWLALVGLLAATQVIAGEIVLPRLMGDRLNLSGFAIILLLVIWGAMWGPAGMFLAIPITVILMIVLAQFPASRFVAVALSKTGRLNEHPIHAPDQPRDAETALDPQRPAQ